MIVSWDSVVNEPILLHDRVHVNACFIQLTTIAQLTILMLCKVQRNCRRNALQVHAHTL